MSICKSQARPDVCSLAVFSTIHWFNLCLVLWPPSNLMLAQVLYKVKSNSLRNKVAYSIELITYS